MDGSAKCGDILQLMQKNIECAICLELLKNPVSTKCDHQFCKFCIIKFVGTQRYVPCPLCKESVSKRSLQDRPELGNIVNKVKDLLNAFNSDKKGESCKARSTNDKGTSSCPPQPVPASLANIQTDSKPTKLADDTNLAPPKNLLDYSEDFSELDLAAEGDLQKYLSKSLAESASKREKSRKSGMGSHTAEAKESVDVISQPQRKENFKTRYTRRKDKNEQDLLRYLEEGSCGAVLDKKSKPSEHTDKEIPHQQDINLCCNYNKENGFNTDVSEEKCQVKNRDMTPTEPRVRSPLSPSKTKAKPKPVGDSMFLDNEDSIGGKDRDCCKGGSHLLSAETGSPMTPDLESASISSTQQLMKPKPVVSRTYSKIMKSTFYADGGSKNWKKTLPSPQAVLTNTNNVHHKGLTTKEKIALKKKGNASSNLIAPSSVIDAEDINDTKQDSSLSTLNVPRQMKRRSIFKSRAQKQDGTAKDIQKSHVDEDEKGVEKEDPYEFQGSQTPKTKIQTQRRGTHAKKGSKQKSKFQHPQLKSQPQTSEGLKNNTLKGIETVSSLKSSKDENSSKNDDNEHNSRALEVHNDFNKSSDINCSDAGNGLDAINIAIVSKNENSDYHPHLAFPKHEDKPRKPQDCDKRKVCFADTGFEKEMVNDRPLTGRPLKSCLQENSNAKSNADFRDINKFLNEGEVNKNSKLKLPEQVSKNSFCETLEQENGVLESGVSHVPSNLKHNMKSVEFDKDKDGKQNMLTKVVNETKICSETETEMLENKDLENIYEDAQNTVKAPKAKRGVNKKKGDRFMAQPYSAEKRTLSRRQKNIKEGGELLKQQSDAELAKMAHKIYEAEDYDFAFSTQEAHKKMEEEKDRQEHCGEAFGFDTLSQEKVKNLQGKQIVDKQAGQHVLNGVPKACEYKPTEDQIPENKTLPEEVERNEDHVSIMDTATPDNIEMHMDALGKSSGEGITNEKAHNGLNFKIKTNGHFQVSDKQYASCSDALKTTNSISLNTLSSEVASLTKMPRLGFMSIKSACTSFPRPNLSLMVEYFPSASSLASTPKAVSATNVTDDVVMDTPSLPISIPGKMQLKSKSEQNPLRNLAFKKPLTCDRESVLETQGTDVLPPSKSDNYEMRTNENKIEKAIKIIDKEHQPEELSPQTSADKMSAFVLAEKPRRRSRRTQILVTSPTKHKKGPEVSHAEAVYDPGTSDSPAGSASHDNGSDDINRKDVLARDTMCIDYEMQDQDVKIDSQGIVPDSVQEEESEYKLDQPEKNAEVVVIEETQGTEETCRPASLTEAFCTQSEKICDEKPCEIPSQEEAQSNPHAEVDFTNSVSSQNVTRIQREVTEEFGENTNSNLCQLSQSVLGAIRNCDVASTSSNTSITSSSSTGIILPTAQEKTHNVNRDIETSENQESVFVSCKKNAEETKENSKPPISSKPDGVFAPTQKSDVEDEDDCEEYDEDEVLMVHRPKQKFAIKQVESIEPIVYNKKVHNSNKQKSSMKENGERNMEMIGETQALDVLEIDSQDMNFVAEESQHGKHKSDSKGQIDEIEETELECEENALHSTEDAVGCHVRTMPVEWGGETVGSAHDFQKNPKLCSSISQQLTETINKRHTGFQEQLEKAESAIDRPVLQEINDTRKCEKADSPCKEINFSMSEKHGNPGSIPDTTLCLTSSEAGRRKRTSRGLAAKKVDEVNACNLSAGAQEAIRISVLETKSNLDAESHSQHKSPSKPSPEVINLDSDADENIDKERKNLHPNMKSHEVKSSKSTNKEPVKKSKRLPEKLSEPIKHNANRDASKINKLGTLNAHTEESNSEQANPTADQVMSYLKACFDNSSSDDEACNEEKHKSFPGPASKSSTKIRKTDETKPGFKSLKRTHPSPLASSPMDGGGDACQLEPLEKSRISAVKESPTESEDEEEERICATLGGRKRFRQQITSDSDEPDEEQSQSKSSVSSVLSSQAEILSTQQANALEGDVDKLRKEIAMYEAKLVAQPDPQQDNSDSDEDKCIGSEDNIQARGDADSAALCKRLPDIFVVNESPDTAKEKLVSNEADKSEDDLFVSPLSPSPPSRKYKVHLPPAKRIKLSETASQLSENFRKQFQSPGGTVRTKKQLDFVQKGSEKDIIVRDEGKHATTERPLSPVLSSQRNKLLHGKNVAEVETGTAEKPKRKLCFVTSGLTKEDNAQALALAKDMDLIFSSKFTKDVTHVVMKTQSDENLVCDRTLKFFQGVANKCWVVAFSWVRRSLSANRLLPEVGFEITGDTSAGEFAGGARRSRESEHPLFENFCFACVGTSQEMPKDSLFELVSVCGATCVEDPVALVSQGAKHKIIVRCSDSDTEPSEVECDMFNGLYKHMNLVTVMREWILDSLGSYALQPMEGYVLNTMDVTVPF